MMKKRIFWIGIAAGLLAAITLFLLLRGRDAPPDWVAWKEGALSASPWEIQLENQHMSAVWNGEISWQPEEETLVQDALLCDINHDGAQELLLLTWRKERYGDSRPFWEEEEEAAWSQHIDIYAVGAGTVQPLWMASDIGMEVVSWQFDPEARLLITDRSGNVTAWDWLTWGLTAIALPKTSFTMAALGDLLIHRQIYDYYLRREDGCFDGMFADVLKTLSSFDVTAIQQETIYVNSPGEYSSYPVFGTPLEVGEAVVKAGFDVVSCAGNHALDKGTDAIDLTASFYRDAGIVCAGIQPVADGALRPYEILEVNGIRCAVFSLTQSTNGHALPEDAPYVLHTLDDPEAVQEAIAAGEADADCSIVFVHWGTEYAAEPDETQRLWAQRFADWGVEVVVGTHPHVLQPVEWVTGVDGHETLVYYSLGNFISAQTEEACRLGGLAWFTITKQGQDCTISNHGLEKVQTREENGRYSTAMATDP